jgi:hypothetical protein
LRGGAFTTWAAVTAGLFLGLAAPAAAAQFTVNAPFDDGDADTSAPACDADTTTPGDQCTLRAAIEQSNATAGRDSIAIPAGTFYLDSALVITDNLQMTGAGARRTSIVGSGDDRVLDLGGSGSSEIADLAISGGELTNGDGAGIRITVNAPVTLSRLWVHDNHIEATEDGHQGGGIANLNSYQTTVADSTISNNSITVTGMGPVEAYGGGLASAFNAGTWIYRSTVTGNSAEGWSSDAMPGGQRGLGGGIAARGPVAVATPVVESTLANNSADGDGNAVGGNVYGNWDIGRSIVAYGEAVDYENCALIGGGVGASVVTDETCGAADADDLRIIGDPMLGPLANNGGPTDTRLPAIGKPAVDAIHDCQPDTDKDQRGFARVVGGGCDAGAVELQADVRVRGGASPASVTLGGHVKYTFGIRNYGPDRSGPVTIQITPPAGFKVTSLKRATEACPSLRCSVHSIAPNQEEYVVLEGTAGAAGHATASASATSALDPTTANNHASASVPVESAPTHPPRSRPALGQITASHTVFRVAVHAAAVARGTVFSFPLSKRARVKIAISRKQGKHRRVVVGSLRVKGKAGLNRVEFSGWLRHGRKWTPLAPGAYRASFVAIDSRGRHSKKRYLSFRVVR